MHLCFIFFSLFVVRVTVRIIKGLKCRRGRFETSAGLKNLCLIKWGLIIYWEKQKK